MQPVEEQWHEGLDIETILGRTSDVAKNHYIAWPDRGRQVPFAEFIAGRWDTNLVLCCTDGGAVVLPGILRSLVGFLV